jgi:hypothetical protein
MPLNTQELDSILDQLNAATSEQLLIVNKHSVDLYKLKRRSDGRKVLSELSVGTRAMMSPNARPQYLQRQLGTVTSIRDTRVVFKLDNGPMGKFHSGNVICNPASLVILKNQPTEN